MSLFAVSAHDIDIAGLALDAEVPLTWLAAELVGTDLTAAAPGHLSARLSRSGHDIVVRGRVKAALSVPCARCLDPAAVPVDTEISLLLHAGHVAGHAGGHPHSPAHPHGQGATPASHRAAGAHEAANGKAKPPVKDDEYEFASGEADQDSYDGETVVLDPFVREAILLEVPNFPLCSEGCPGIRPAAAEAPPEPAPRIDPRLAPLGALRDKLPTRPISKKKTKE